MTCGFPSTMENTKSVVIPFCPWGALQEDVSTLQCSSWVPRGTLRFDALIPCEQRSLILYIGVPDKTKLDSMWVFC